MFSQTLSITLIVRHRIHNDIDLYVHEYDEVFKHLFERLIYQTFSNDLPLVARIGLKFYLTNVGYNEEEIKLFLKIFINKINLSLKEIYISGYKWHYYFDDDKIVIL
jgi:hypothetical protein